MATDEDQPRLEVILDRLQEMEARMDALSRGNAYLRERVDELEAENDSLRGELAELGEVVDPDPGSREYASLSKAQKVHRLRRTLVEQAARATTKRAKMEYTDVIYLFDGHPSPGHAYDLMRAASNLEGFQYDTSGERQNRITVDLESVNDESLVHAANKATQGMGGR